MENEIYVSTDIEADGPIPGLYSMLSIGSAAYKVDGRLLGTFSANLATLPGATEHPEHRKFWSDHPDAWEVARKDPRDPSIVMTEYVEWIKALPGIPVFVGFPAAYDFSFVAWYLHKFTGECPFFHSALDMKTLAMSLLRLPFRESVKRNMPKRWFGVAQHTCCALDDAIEQGAAFCRMMGEVWERSEKA